jgi:ketosteroid isomerase-like protein
MSQENVEIVKRAVAALNERDVDRYLADCTENIEVRTPFAPVSGVYQGPEDVRRYFADIEDTSPDFRLELERVEEIGPDRVLAFLRVTASWRASGIPAATGIPTTNLYDLVDGKIRRVRIFLDRQEALEAAGQSE